MNRAPIQLAILDMAGTTIREDGAVARAVDKAMVDSGLSAVTSEELLPLRGMAKTDFFAHLAPTPEKAHEANERFIEAMLAAVSAGELTPREDVLPLFSELRQKGTTVCLMTGFAPAVQEALLVRLDWTAYVDFTVAETPALRGRPHPDMVFSAMAHAHVDSVANVLVAGDTTNDMNAGTRAGVAHVVAVLGGAHSFTQLEAAPHTNTVTNLKELADLARALNSLTFVSNWTSTASGHLG